jgi:lipopolysaccharide transport protein LptA
LSLITISFTALPSTNSPLLSNNAIEFKNSTYRTYGQGDEQLVLKSKKGNINILNKAINLIGEVEGKFTLDGKTFSLRSESLTGNLLDKSISSKEKVLFLANSIEIISSSMEITQTQPEGVKILFRNANLGNINSKSNIRKGKANKIEFFPAKDLIFMEGNTELYQENMKIISDEIHYDLNEDRILKSVNSKIINN